MKKLLEKNVHSQVCDYLKLQYPNIIFTSDASGLRLSMGLRVEMKRKRCTNYVIPDLLVLHPSKEFHGLLIEIKRSLADVYKKDSTFKKDDHVMEQANSISQLNKLGYKAAFGCGFDHCKRIIDEYLK